MSTQYVQHVQNFHGDVTVIDGTLGFSQNVNTESGPSRSSTLVTGSTATNSSPPSLKRVPPPSKTFIGREEILDKMRNALCSEVEEQVVYVLHGFGGVGKTQIMSKFVQKYRSLFDHVYLIDSSSESTILSSYRGMGYQEAQLSNDLDDKNMLEQVHDWFGTMDGSWILVFDNADDPSVDLGRFLPTCPRGRIIVTTRNESYCAYAYPAECESPIGELELNEAVSLLHKLIPPRKRSVQNAQEISERIVEELGRLALAISHAGSYIAQSTSQVFSSYPELLNAKRKEILSRKRTHATDGYELAIYASWELSFSKLTADPNDKYGIAASHLLQICGFFHPKEISVTIFQRAFELSARSDLAWELTRHMADDSGEWDPEACHEIFNKLGVHSLVSVVAEGLFSIHSLVHKWTRDRLSDEAKALCERQALHVLAGSMTWDETTDEIDYRRSLLIHLLQHDVASVLSAEMQVCGIFSKVFTETGHWTLAETIQKASLVREAEELGEDHEHTLMSMDNLAVTYWYQGRWCEAEELQLKALRLRTERLGPDHPTTVGSMANLASIYLPQGRWGEAEELQLTVMQLNTERLGSDHPNTLKSTANLASIYWKQGRWNEAAELELKVKQLRTEKLGPNHPDTLISMANLASIYRDQGRWSEAEELQLTVRQLSTKWLGPDHPDTLKVMADLAMTYFSQGRCGEAEELHLTVMQLRTERLGRYHPNTLSSMAHVAIMYANQGRLGKAEYLQLQVVHMRSGRLGSNHPDTLASMGDLAMTYWHQRRLDEAEELQLTVMRLSTERLGSGHPHTLESMARLANTYGSQGRCYEAEEQELKVMQLSTERFGPDHPSTIGSMNNLAITYVKLKKWVEAEEMLVKAAERSRQRMGQNHPDAQLFQENLDRFYQWRDAATHDKEKTSPDVDS